MMQFENVREKLASQYADIKWIKESGLDEASLKEGYHQLMAALEGAPKPIIKARTFEYLVKNGRIAIDEQDIFQDRNSIACECWYRRERCDRLHPDRLL